VFLDNPRKWVRECQTILDFNAARDDRIGSGGQPELKDVQISSQIITIVTPTFSFLTGQMFFRSPNQQCQSNEGNTVIRCISQALSFVSTRQTAAQVLLPGVCVPACHQGVLKLVQPF